MMTLETFTGVVTAIVLITTLILAGQVLGMYVLPKTLSDLLVGVNLFGGPFLVGRGLVGIYLLKRREKAEAATVAE